MASRIEGGRKGKLSGHAVERKAREYLLRACADAGLRAAFDRGSIHGIGHGHMVAIIGDVHITSEVDSGKLTIPKADIIVDRGEISGGSTLLGLSIKKLNKRRGRWGSEAQAWDVPVDTFVDLIRRDGVSLTESEESALQRFALREVSDPAEWALLVEFLRRAMEPITRRTFSLGNTRSGPFRATHLWFVPEGRPPHSERFGHVFPIEMICLNAAKRSDLVDWRRGATTIELPWGSVQKTRSGNRSLQFRHDFQRIQALISPSTEVPH